MEAKEHGTLISIQLKTINVLDLTNYPETIIVNDIKKVKQEIIANKSNKDSIFLDF